MMTMMLTKAPAVGCGRAEESPVIMASTTYRDDATGWTTGRMEVATTTAQRLNAVRHRPEYEGFHWEVRDGVALGHRWVPAIIVDAGNVDRMLDDYISALRVARAHRTHDSVENLLPIA